MAPTTINTYSSPPTPPPLPTQTSIAHLHPRLRPPSPNPPATPPTSWTWNCCRRNCQGSFPLGVTTRCIRCNHRSCLANYKGRTKQPCGSAFEYGVWEARNEWRRDRMEYLANPKAWDARTQGRFLRLSEIKSTRLRRATRSTYEKERKARRFEKRMKRLENGTNNCWTDCDYPGQCHMERHRATKARAERQRKINEATAPAESP